MFYPCLVAWCLAALVTLAFDFEVGAIMIGLAIFVYVNRYVFIERPSDSPRRPEGDQ